MKIRISSLGALSIEGADEDGFLEIEENMTVKQLARMLAVDEGLGRHIPVIVNGQLAQRSDRLKDGDEIMFVMPPTGG
jgi:molybdopterin converting factor small subunit